ncbi:hypothetical protein ACFS07_27240 [Undibacterium arcticum]
MAGLELPQRQDFIDWLVDVHTHALRATTASAPSLSAIHEHFSRFIDDPERDVPAAVTPTKKWRPTVNFWMKQSGSWNWTCCWSTRCLTPVTSSTTARSRAPAVPAALA